MQPNPDVPIAISLIGRRYFLFSADLVAYLRREHRICGVLIGSIPQIPQQNVFLGLPLELMPEEAQLLIDKGVAYIVDDVIAHDEGLQSLEKRRRQDYLASLQQAGEKAAKSQEELREQKKEQALKKRGLGPARSDAMESAEVLDGDEASQAEGSTNAAPQSHTYQHDSLPTPPIAPQTPPNHKSTK